MTISWSLHGDVVSSDPDIITTALGTRSSILTISQVGYRHSGDYTCRATNNAGTYAHTATLRVNGILYDKMGEMKKGHKMNSLHCTIS